MFYSGGKCASSMIDGTSVSHSRVTRFACMGGVCGDVYVLFFVFFFSFTNSSQRSREGNEEGNKYILLTEIHWSDSSSESLKIGPSNYLGEKGSLEVFSPTSFSRQDLLQSLGKCSTALYHKVLNIFQEWRFHSLS